MAILGSTTLLIALALGVYSVTASVVGTRRRSPQMVESGRYAIYLLPLVLAVSVATLVVAFLIHDFSLSYVAGHSNSFMDPKLVWVAFYAGNEGSLLFIAFALSCVGALAVALASSNTKFTDSLPYTGAVIMVVLVFFLAVMHFLANPFASLDFVPADGQGINPLLTHFGMFIHPPVMMTGLVSLTVPFAFAMGSLLAGKTGDEWVDYGRSWGLVSFAILGSGLLLGAWWAYTILGWGGYWGWDPIENVGLMPFLALTAFVHSIMVQKRRGVFRMWNIVLISIAFNLAALGMFFNRAGPVPSVHSFGQSTVGWSYLTFFAVSAAFSTSLFFLRYGSLKSARNLESMLSREAAFLVNNLLLLAVAFVTLWGVIFPLVSQLAQGVTVTVGAPFYNKVNGPLLLSLIFVMAVGPMLPWRRASASRLKSTLLVPTLIAVSVVVVLLVLGVRSPYALASFGLCALVVVGIFREWATGSRARHSRGESYPIALVRLIASNRPRYGGYIAHLSILLLALGVTGSSFYNIQRDVVLSPGQRVTVGGYQLEYLDSSFTSKGDRVERIATLRAYRGDSPLGIMEAQNHFYPSFRMSSTRSAIRSTPVEDLYIIPQEFFDDGRVAFRILINPLVWWMWVAGPVFILGTLVSLWPGPREAVAYVTRPERATAPSIMEVT